MTRKANSRQETEGSNHRELRDHKEILFVYFALFPDRDSEALDFRAASELLRRTLFDAQDEIDSRREQIIADIEGKLQQRLSRTALFPIRWKLA